MESGLVGLRAELHKKRAEACKYGAGQKGLLKRDLEKQSKKTTSFHTSNAGVSARAERDREQLEEEKVTQEKARSILEKKAAMYERLHGGIEALEDDALNQRYLIDFQKKIVNEVLEKKKLRTVEKNRSKNQSEHEESNPDDYEASKEEEEWVEYTDAFGRTRECMKKDLPAMLEQDRELAKDINQDDTSGGPDLLSEDMRREIQRQKWEREEELNTLKKDLHYQDVLFDEARAHGAGYMRFSRDEKKRKEQMDLLNDLRAETKQAETAKASAASKKQKMLQLRLEKVRQRKRLKMGLPMIDDDKLKTPPASDDEEGNDDPIGSPAPPEILEKSCDSGLKERNIKANKSSVREWDLGKEGVTSVLSQEEWVDRQRKQRNSEFAPPSVYDSNKKCKYSKCETDEGSSSSNIHQEYFSSSSSCNVLSDRLYNQTGASQCSGQYKHSTNDSSGDCLREGRDPKFAPPSTFEYYGPSSVKGRNHHTKIHYTAMEESINKGIAHYRKLSNE